MNLRKLLPLSFTLMVLVVPFFATLLASHPSASSPSPTPAPSASPSPPIVVITELTEEEARVDMLSLKNGVDIFAGRPQAEITARWGQMMTILGDLLANGQDDDCNIVADFDEGEEPACYKKDDLLPNDTVKNIIRPNYPYLPYPQTLRTAGQAALEYSDGDEGASSSVVILDDDGNPAPVFDAETNAPVVDEFGDPKKLSLSFGWNAVGSQLDYVEALAVPHGDGLVAGVVNVTAPPPPVITPSPSPSVAGMTALRAASLALVAPEKIGVVIVNTNDSPFAYPLPVHYSEGGGSVTSEQQMREIFSNVGTSIQRASYGNANPTYEIIGPVNANINIATRGRTVGVGCNATKIRVAAQARLTPAQLRAYPKMIYLYKPPATFVPELGQDPCPMERTGYIGAIRIKVGTVYYNKNIGVMSTSHLTVRNAAHTTMHLYGAKEANFYTKVGISYVSYREIDPNDDFMGNRKTGLTIGSVGALLSPVTKAALHWIPANSLITADAAGTYTLRPQEQDPIGGQAHVLVLNSNPARPTASIKYYVSFENGALRIRRKLLLNGADSQLLNTSTTLTCTGTDKSTTNPTNKVRLKAYAFGGTGGYTYSWSGATFAAVRNQPTLIDATVGVVGATTVYPLTLTVTDSGGSVCTDPVNLTVNPVGIRSFSPTEGPEHTALLSAIPVGGTYRHTTYAFSIIFRSIAGGNALVEIVRSAGSPSGPPRNLTAAAIAGPPVQVNLSWLAPDPNTGVTGYLLLRRLGASGEWESLTNDEDLDLSETSFVDTTALPRTTYTYSLQARKGGVLSTAVTRSVTTPASADVTGPDAPTLTALATGYETVVLDWSEVSDAESGVSTYQIWRNSNLLTTQNATDETTFIDDSASPNTIYNYRVIAFDTLGNPSDGLAAQANVTVTTPGLPDATAPIWPSAPPAPVVAAVLGRNDANGTYDVEIRINQPAVDPLGAAGEEAPRGLALYTISRNVNGVTTELGSIASDVTTFSDSGVPLRLPVYYTVVAVDASAASNTSVPTYAIPLMVDAGPDAAIALPVRTLTVTGFSNPQRGPSLPANTSMVTLWSSSPSVGVTRTTPTRTDMMGHASTFTFPNTAGSYTLTFRVTKDAVVVSDTLTVTVNPVDATAASVPANLRSTAVTQNSISLAWDPSTDAESGVTGYEIRRDGGAALSLPGNIHHIYTHTGLVTGSAHTYEIRSVNGAGLRSAYTPVLSVSTSPDTTAGSIPVNLRKTTTTQTSITTAWNASTDAESGITRYELRIDSAATPIAVTALTYVHTGVTAGSTHTYEVRSVNGAGLQSDWTAALSAASLPDTTAPSVPASLRSTGNTSTSIGLAWNASTDAESGITGYELMVDGSATLISQVGITYTHSGLSPSTTHTYKVRSVNGATLRSAWTAVFSSTTAADTTAPSLPGNLRTTAVSTNAVTLTWDAATDAESGIASYDIRKNTDTPITISAAPYTFNSLIVNTAYNFQVRSTNGAGLKSTWTTALPVTTMADTTAPSIPANIRTTSVTSTSVALAWDAATDAESPVTGYEVRMDGGTPASIAGTTYTQTGLTAGTNHNFEVRSVNSAGLQSAWSTALPVTTTTDPTPPSLPASLRSTTITYTSLAIAWNASTDAESGITGYELIIDGSATPISQVGNTYTHAGLMAGTTHTYKVRACNGAGLKSAWTTVLSLTTTPDATAGTVPTGLATTAITQNSIAIAWNASTDAESGITGYELVVDAAVTPLSVAGTTYTHPGLAAGSPHTYKVRSVNGAGLKSVYTAVLNASTTADTTPPSVPASLRSTNITENSIALAWDAATDTESGVTGYEVRRDNEATPVAVAALVYTHSGLGAGTTHTYEIRAVNGAGLRSPWSTPALSITTTNLNATYRMVADMAANREDRAVAVFAGRQGQASGRLLLTGSTATADSLIQPYFSERFRANGSESTAYATDVNLKNAQAIADICGYGNVFFVARGTTVQRVLLGGGNATRQGAEFPLPANFTVKKCFPERDGGGIVIGVNLSGNYTTTPKHAAVIKVLMPGTAATCTDSSPAPCRMWEASVARGGTVGHETTTAIQVGNTIVSFGIETVSEVLDPPLSRGRVVKIFLFYVAPSVTAPYYTTQFYTTGSSSMPLEGINSVDAAAKAGVNGYIAFGPRNSIPMRFEFNEDRSARNPASLAADALANFNFRSLIPTNDGGFALVGQRTASLAATLVKLTNLGIYSSEPPAYTFPGGYNNSCLETVVETDINSYLIPAGYASGSLGAPTPDSVFVHAAASGVIAP